MRKVLLALTAMGIAFSLAGCASSQKKELDEKIQVLTHLEKQMKEVVKVETKVVAPPDELLRPCSVAKPPNRALYMRSTFEKREGLLVEHARDQKIAVDKCNIQITGVRNWKKEQLEIRNKADKKQ